MAHDVDMDKDKVEVGDLVMERVSKFEGVVTGLHRWITGCMTATVTPRSIDKDGKPGASASFDVPRLLILNKAEVVLELHAPDSPKRTGGPQEEVSREGAR